MHVSKEFLMEAVGLSLLVALLLISMQLFQRATKLTSLLEEGQERQINEIEEYEIIKYDGLAVDGMTAVIYITRVTGTYGLPVEVVTLNGIFFVEGKEAYEELRSSSSEKYINPLAKYRCSVLRDENQVISKIKFEVEKEGEK